MSGEFKTVKSEFFYPSSKPSYALMPTISGHDSFDDLEERAKIFVENTASWSTTKKAKAIFRRN